MSQTPSAADVEELSGLCEALIAANPSPGLVANPLLHVLSAHPGILARYDAVWNEAGSVDLRVAMKSWARRIESALRAPEDWLGDPLPGSADILFVSHFLPTQANGAGDDLYFGTLPERLAELGVSSVVARINHTGRRLARPARKPPPSPVPRLILSDRLATSDEQEIGAALREARNWLLAQHRGSARRRALVQMLAATQAGEATRTAMRIGGQIGRLVAQLRPKLLVTTYEGHSWERLSYRAAHQANPATICAGYNHAVLFPMQRAMGARLSNGYDPDILLTAGEVTHDRWIDEPRLQGLPVEVLGSVRGHRQEEQAAVKKADVCLVLPEGLLSESRTLAEFMLEAAATLPRVTFRLRLHPAISQRSLVARVPQLRTPPANVQWSTGDLAGELASGRWAIYRGTSTIIQAVQHGVRPLYLKLKTDPFDFDPLATLQAWRVRVTDLSSFMRAIETTPAEQELDVAKLYCARYFTPMRTDVLMDLVRA